MISRVKLALTIEAVNLVFCNKNSNLLNLFIKSKCTEYRPSQQIRPIKSSQTGEKRRKECTVRLNS